MRLSRGGRVAAGVAWARAAGALGVAWSGVGLAQDGFVLSDDGAGNRLTLGGVLQYRYSASFIEDEEGAGPGGDETIGFSIRRLRLQFRATALGGRVRLFIQPEAFPGSFQNLDSWVEAEVAEGLSLRGGQFVLPFNRESLVPVHLTQGMERAATSFAINPVAFLRTIGVMATYRRGESRVMAALTNGTAGLNRGFADEETGDAATIRFETAAIGVLDTFRAGYAPRGTPTGLLLGGAVHAEQREAGGDRFAWTSDISFYQDGLAAQLIVGGHVAEDLNRGPDPLPEHALGLSATVGYFIAEDFQPFIRYEFGTTSDEEHPDLHLIVTGFHWFLIGRALQFSADVGVAIGDVGPVFSRPLDAFFVETSGSELFIRGQIQFLF